MRKYVKALGALSLALLYCAVLPLPRAAAQAAPDVDHLEYIENFLSFVSVGSDGSLEVVENITYDFGSNERHGIYRDIPLKYDNGKRAISISDIDVTTAGSASFYPFATSQEGGYLRIKIGDPDVLITGRKDYAIHYRVKGAVQWGRDSDRLIWNATGDGWQVPIDQAGVALLLPTSTPASSVKLECYQGPYGSTETCKIEGNLFKATRPILAGEGLTISATFPKGILTAPTALDRLWEFLATYWPAILPLGALIFLFRRWWQKGRDPRGRGTIVPQYEPPAGLTPIEAGVLYKGGLRPTHVSAEIVSLAVRGFIKINPLGDGSGKPDDYQLEKLKEATAEDPLFDRVLMSGLFAATLSVNTLSGLRKVWRQAQAMKNLQDADPVQVMQEMFGSQKDVTMSTLKGKFQSVLESVRSAVFQSMIGKGYYAKDPNKVRGPYIFAAIAAFMLAMFFLQSWPVALFSVIATAILIGVFGAIMPKVTPEGALAKEHVLGFRDYLDIAEKDRLNFHNAPERTPEIFEAFLPYALALGVVDAWAKEFQGIYTEPPKWYGGHYAGTFAAASFAHDLSGFSSFAGSSVGASSSGGSSGGFSGGGGGGGGGGSW